MALPLLARAVGGSLVKGAAKKAIGGGKKKIKPEMISPGGGSGGSGGGAIIKSKVVSVPSSALVPVKKSPEIKTGTDSGIVGILETIRANVKQIDEFYKGTLAAKREEIKKRKKQESDDRKADQETKLEKPKIDKKPKNLKGLKMPKTGLLDGIFKFIGTVLMGMLVMKLIDFADTIAKSGILPMLGKIGDFVLNVGGKILDGLVTFIDKAYDFYDGFRKSIGDNFGEGAQEQFDNLSGTLNKVLNTVFSVGLAISLLAGAIPQKKPRKPRRPRNVRQRARNIQRIRNQRRAQGLFGRIKSGFQAAGDGLAKAGRGALDVGVSGLKAIGGGLNRISGGNLGKLGTFLGEQYQNISKGARKQFDRVAGLGTTLKGKFGSAMQSVAGAVDGAKKGAQKFIVQRIIEPLKPFLEPVIKRVQSIGEKVTGIMKKNIPGFDNVLQVLKKKGISGLGDTAGILKNVGGKALPIVGGLFNLMFAYDRLAGGDTIGALLEFLSAGFDFLPILAPGAGAFGPNVSMGIDAYMFARDFVPLIQQGENTIVSKLGLSGIKSSMDSMASKLPDLGTIVAKFQGKDVEQKSPGQIASTSTDGSAAPAASAKPATTTTPTTASSITPEEQGDASEAAQRILKDFPQITSKGSSPQIYASGLGFYLKKMGAGEGGKGDYGDPPGAPHGGMEHPDHGGVVASHAGTGHYRGVAVDLGANSATSNGYNDDQKNLWPFISNYLKKYGLNKEPVIPQVIHGPGESFSPRKNDTMGPDGGHHDHFHVEFQGGGYVGGKYNMKSIERRASYEGGEQMINIPIPMPQQQSNYQQPEPAMMGSVSATSSDDPFEFLEFQG